MQSMVESSRKARESGSGGNWTEEEDSTEGVEAFRLSLGCFWFGFVNLKFEILNCLCLELLVKYVWVWINMCFILYICSIKSMRSPAQAVSFYLGAIYRSVHVLYSISK